ncbi:MAG TPA: lipopolysaccharide biosynthesis protein [Conexibacter sp.]|nr:lipopolysaccharide biosynthesis protein [Conexibacter sp.]
MSADAGTPSVGTRTLRGMAWAYGSYVGGRLLLLASTAILARVLVPADFGLVALALTFMVFLDTLRDLGLGQALIVGHDDQEARAQTVFSWTVVIGLGLTLITFAAAPFASQFFHEGSRFTALLAALGCNFFLRSLGATHYALARKELDYRTRTIAEFADVMTRGSSAIVLALAGAGPWSLVIGYLVGTMALNVVVWVLVPFRPRLQLSRAHLRELLTFGGMLTLVDIGSALAHQMDYLFVGRVLGPASLGLYTIGFRLPELLIINVAVVAGDVLFPAYAMINRDRLRDAFLLAMRSTAFVIFPMAVALAILARPIVLALFGDRWIDSIKVMQVLVIYGVAITLSIPSGTVFKATGQAWILVVLTIPYVTLLVTLLTIFTDHGIVAVAGCMAGMQAGFLSFTWLIAARRLGVNPARVLAQLGRPLVAAAALAIVLYPLEHAIDSPWPALVAGGIAGGAVYALMVWLLERDMALRVRDAAFGGRRAANAG